MENAKNKEDDPKAQNASAEFKPGNRDFQRRKEDIDEVSKSEKEELERRKRRTHEASTKPDKNKIN